MYVSMSCCAESRVFSNRSEKKMEWAELIVHTTTSGADTVSSLFLDYGASGTMVEDRADIPDPGKPHGIWEIIDPKLLEEMPEDVLVHAWLEPGVEFSDLLEEIRLRLDALRSACPDFGTLKLDTRTVKDEDWSEVWKKYYKPFYLGKHLVIRPTWEAYMPQPGDLVISMDPGMAFGSGTHETTAMCSTLLEEIIQGGESVIDVGTGSGILAIAAALSGATRVLAIDIDPDAVRVARENVSLNQVDSVVTVKQGDLLRDVDMESDIVVANIISDIIIRFAGALLRHVRPGGRLICSGIVKQREEEVRHALEDAGCEILRAEHRGEWVAFLTGRPF